MSETGQSSSPPEKESTSPAYPEPAETDAPCGDETDRARHRSTRRRRNRRIVGVTSSIRRRRSRNVVVVGRSNRVHRTSGRRRNVPLTYSPRKNSWDRPRPARGRIRVDGTCLVINGDQIVDSRIVRDTIGTRRTPPRRSRCCNARTSRVRWRHRRRRGRDEHRREPERRPGLLPQCGVYVLEPMLFDAVRATEPSGGEHHQSRRPVDARELR